MILPELTSKYRNLVLLTRDRLFDKFSGWGYEPDSQARIALDALLDTYRKCLCGLAEPKYYLASIDPGMGKTESVVSFLNAWKSQGFQPRGSVLIGLSRLTEIESYIEKAGLDADDFCVVTTDSTYNALGGKDAWNAPILFTTQQMIMSRTSGTPFSDVELFYYQGKPRTLRIWDESLVPGQDVTIRLDTLYSLAEPLRPVARRFVEVVEAFLDGVRFRADWEDIRIPSFVPALEVEAKLLTSEQKLAADAFREMAGKPMTLVPSNLRGCTLVGCASTLPDDFAPAVILDASGRVRGSYALWERYRGNLVRLPAAVNNYAKLDIHLWPRKSGRATLNVEHERETILSAVADLINSKPSTKWLVVHHMAREGEFDIEKELGALLDDEECASFIHWGNHHGFNTYRDVRHVVVIGAWSYADVGYAALHSNSSGLTASQIDHDELRSLKGAELQHHLLQAVCRASVRNSSDGVCGPCTAYIITSSREGLEVLIRNAFPGCRIHDWQPVLPRLKGQAKALTDELARRFSETDVTSISKEEIRLAAGIRHASALNRLLRRIEVKAFLAEHAIRNERWTFTRHRGLPAPAHGGGDTIPLRVPFPITRNGADGVTLPHV